MNWPTHLQPGAVRWARASGHYEETVAFYRDLVGLPVIGTFAASFGEDGTIFGLPDTTVQLEIVRAHHGDASPRDPEQLVLYLHGADAVSAATSPLREQGMVPHDPAYPYWAAVGASTYRDPDGHEVVFAPWVSGVDPEPELEEEEEEKGTGPARAGSGLHMDWYDGDRTPLRPLFELADDSPVQIDAYLNAGDLLLVRRGDEPVAHLQLVPALRESDVELKSMAVVAELRGSGIGRRLIDEALAECQTRGFHRMLVSTATADVGNLRFYQRCGFRFLTVERDAFTPESGYPDAIRIDGVPLRDRVWLSREISRREPPERMTGR